MSEESASQKSKQRYRLLKMQALMSWMSMKPGIIKAVPKARSHSEESGA